MHNEFAAIIERDGTWIVAYCPDVPGANGQGISKAPCMRDLSAAISLILEDRRKDGCAARHTPSRRKRFSSSAE